MCARQIQTKHQSVYAGSRLKPTMCEKVLPYMPAFPGSTSGSACTASFSRFAQRFAVGTAIAGRPPPSGRIEARTGLRMMPTSPRSPLSFRTAGFPQYGWKDGISDGAFPTRRTAQACSRHTLATCWFASVLRASHFVSPNVPLSVGSVTRRCTAVEGG